MNALLLTLSLAAASPPVAEGRPATTATTAAPASLDGNWTVICIEKDGQPVADAKNHTVIAKGNTITCSGKDGKPAMTWTLEFTGPGMVTVKGFEGDKTSDRGTANDRGTAEVTKQGVYVLTTDMLALCIHDSADKNAGTSNVGTTGPNAKSKCSIILKREGTTRERENK